MPREQEWHHRAEVQSHQEFARWKDALATVVTLAELTGSTLPPCVVREALSRALPHLRQAQEHLLQPACETRDSIERDRQLHTRIYLLEEELKKAKRAILYPMTDLA